MQDKYFVFRQNKFSSFKKAVRKHGLFLQDIAKKLDISSYGLSKKIERSYWFSESDYYSIKEMLNMTDYDLSKFVSTLQEQNTSEEEKIVNAINHLNEAMKCLEGYKEVQTMISYAKGLATILLGNELVKQRFEDL